MKSVMFSLGFVMMFQVHSQLVMIDDLMTNEVQAAMG